MCFQKVASKYRNNGYNVGPFRYISLEGAKAKQPVQIKNLPKSVKEGFASDDLFETWLSQDEFNEILVWTGGDSRLVAFDIDYDGRAKGELMASLLHVLPDSPVQKFGSKGITLFYRASDEDWHGRPYSNARWGKKEDGENNFFDILWTGQQCFIPPSRHKFARIQYKWTKGSFEDVPLADLPVLTLDDVIEAEAVCDEFREKYFLEPLDGVTATGNVRDDEWREKKIYKFIFARLMNGDSIDRVVRDVIAYDQKVHHGEPWLQTSDRRGRRSPEEFARWKVSDVATRAQDALKQKFGDSAHVGQPPRHENMSYVDFFKGHTGRSYVIEVEDEDGKVKRKSLFAEFASDLFEARCYVETKDGPYVFNGKVWELFNSKSIESLIHLKVGDQFHSNTIKEFIAKAKTKNNETRNEFKELPESHLVLNNGILDGKTRTLKPHSSAYFNKSAASVSFDPKAKAPEFERYLDAISVGNESLKEELLKLLQYILFVKGNPEQLCFYLVGVGSNGKSVFLNILKALLSPDSWSALDCHEVDLPFTGIHLDGKIVNIKDEPRRKIINPERMKDVICGGHINDSYKGKEKRTFKVMAKFIFAANEPPDSKDTSFGFYRRIRPLRFERIFGPGEADHGIEGRIIATELSGVLNMALDAHERYLAGERFRVDEEMTEEMEAMREENDPLYLFVREYVEPSVGAMITGKEAYDAYLNFCNAEGISQSARLSNTAYKRLFKRLFCEVHRGHRVKFRQRVRVDGERVRADFGYIIKMQDHLSGQEVTFGTSRHFESIST